MDSFIWCFDKILAIQLKNLNFKILDYLFLTFNESISKIFFKLIIFLNT